ncbi:hypothetical protein DL769_011143 [Monosporascus sp. CRB-8-3]|nr:hypothetical protein DL769_011143 [Monosporascus sp. CRB-8-3]
MTRRGVFDGSGAWIQCETSTALNRFDFQDAFGALKSRCHTGAEESLPEDSHIFAKEGTAVVYACNRGGYNHCRDEELDGFKVMA